MMPAFTARNVTKFIAKSIVAVKAAELTADAITDHTHYEEDDIVVDLGSKVIGWYVSEKLEPVTDKIVDTAADFITDRRTKRQIKKDAKKNK
jgi:hypothetical protein